VTALDLITDALRELRVLNAVDPPGGEDAALGLSRLNMILDDFNAERPSVYADTITTYTLTPGLNPHTIGPTGTLVTNQRPVSIAAANILVSGLRSPVAIRDAAWWLSIADPSFSDVRPTDLMYQPEWPNGKIYLYGVPSAANTLELLSSVVLGSLAIGDTFTMPPGYQSALTLTLAEALSAPMGVELSPMTARNAAKARARILSNNLTTPTLVTRDAGMPGARRSTFDYRTGRSR
jgi:hypothetical protein